MEDTEQRTVDVIYRSPVYVTVNLDTGEVENVSIDDAATEYWYCDGGSTTDTTRAREIAEDCDWPAWSFG